MNASKSPTLPAIMLYLFFTLFLASCNYQSAPQAEENLAAQFSETGAVIPGILTARAKFGSSVAISGNTIVVGVPGDNGNTGSVYLMGPWFGGFAPFAKLIPSDGLSGDLFGSTVAVSGDTIMVGVPGKAGVFGKATGAVYIFGLNQPGFIRREIKKLVPSDNRPKGAFGSSLAMSGDFVAVGAPGVDQAYVFGRNQFGMNNWGQVRIIASGVSSGQHFGNSVAMSSDTLMVGAPNANVDINNDGIKELGVGAVHVFQKDQGGTDRWGEVKRLAAGDLAEFDGFGFSLAMHGDTLVVGTPFKASYRGAAYLFEHNQNGASSWGESKKLLASDGTNTELFGISVSTNGDDVIVGAPYEDHDTNGDGINELDVGAAYLFSRNADTWREVKKLIVADGAAHDRYGFAVAISDLRLAVGAPLDDKVATDSGNLYVEVR